MVIKEKIVEMENFLKEGLADLDERDMSNQLCGYKQAVKDMTEELKFA